MVDVQQLIGFGGRKIGGVAAEKFQGVPLGRVVAGPDGDASGRVHPPDGVLDHRSRRDAQIDDIPAARHERCNYPFANHDAARARIAAHDHALTRLEKSPERGREVQHVRRRHPGAYDAAQSHLRDPQQFGRLLRHSYSSFIFPKASGTKSCRSTKSFPRSRPAGSTRV